MSASLSPGEQMPVEIGDDGPALGERAGLVEGDHVDGGGFLEIDAALEKNAAAGGVRDGGEDRGGRADDERARRGDHHDGHGAVKGGGESVAEHPDRDDDERGGEKDDAERVEFFRALEEALRRRLLRLGFLNQRDQLGKRGLSSDLGDPHLEAAMLVERAGKKRIARLLVDGHRFAGDGGLVNAAGALDDHPVNRDAFARPDENEIADNEVLDLYVDGFNAPLAERGDRPELDERGDGGAAALDGEFLERVRKREEKEEHGALEGVMDVGGAERGQDHEQIDIDGAVEQRADAVKRPVPASGEIGGEKKPRRERGRKAQMRAEAAKEHEDERGGDAPQLEIPPGGVSQDAAQRRRCGGLPCRHYRHHGLLLVHRSNIGITRK